MQEIGMESSLVEDIRSGRKYIEGLLGRPKYLKIAEDDIVSIREDLWLNGQIIDSLADSVRVKVTEVLYFESFSEMFAALDYKAAIPSAKSIKEAVAAYRKLYPEDEENEYGVVALLFELTD